MAKKYRIKLSEQERSYLNDIVKRGKAAAYKRRHAHILLLADECGEHGGMKDEEIVDAAVVGVATVERVRHRCVEEGLSAPLEGWRHVEVTERRTKEDWAEVIRDLVNAHYPEKRIVLVMDNLNTHSPASFYKAFSPWEARRIIERLEIHYTPKHGSWLNMAEIEIGVLRRQCLDRRIADRETLREEVRPGRGDATKTGTRWIGVSPRRMRESSLNPYTLQYKNDAILVSA